MDRVTRILIEARDLIENVGWCQNQPVEYDESGERVAFCALGALRAGALSAGGNGFELDEDMAYLRLARVAFGYSSVARYNDTHGRTKSEVLALFDAAIAAGE